MVGWVALKVITTRLLSSEPQDRKSTPKEHPKFYDKLQSSIPKAIFRGDYVSFLRWANAVGERCHLQETETLRT